MRQKLCEAKMGCYIIITSKRLPDTHFQHHYEGMH